MWQTDRLSYGDLQPRHASGLVTALDHPAVATYIGGPDVTTVAALEDRIERLRVGPADPQVRWINIVVAADEVIIGRLEATTYGTWCELAWVFGPAFWGHGYATEAVTWFLDHLRVVHAVKEFWACVHPENTRSVGLAERVGMMSVGMGSRRLASYDDGDLVYMR